MKREEALAQCFVFLADAEFVAREHQLEVVEKSDGYYVQPKSRLRDIATYMREGDKSQRDYINDHLKNQGIMPREEAPFIPLHFGNMAWKPELVRVLPLHSTQLASLAESTVPIPGEPIGQWFLPTRTYAGDCPMDAALEAEIVKHYRLNPHVFEELSTRKRNQLANTLNLLDEFLKETDLKATVRMKLDTLTLLLVSGRASCSAKALEAAREGKPLLSEAENRCGTFTVMHRGAVKCHRLWHVEAGAKADEYIIVFRAMQSMSSEEESDSKPTAARGQTSCIVHLDEAPFYSESDERKMEQPTSLLASTITPAQSAELTAMGMKKLTSFVETRTRIQPLHFERIFSRCVQESGVISATTEQLAYYLEHRMITMFNGQALDMEAFKPGQSREVLSRAFNDQDECIAARVASIYRAIDHDQCSIQFVKTHPIQEDTMIKRKTTEQSFVRNEGFDSAFNQFIPMTSGFHSTIDVMMEHYLARYMIVSRDGHPIELETFQPGQDTPVLARWLDQHNNCVATRKPHVYRDEKDPTRFYIRYDASDEIIEHSMIAALKLDPEIARVYNSAKSNEEWDKRHDFYQGGIGETAAFSIGGQSLVMAAGEVFIAGSQEHKALILGDAKITATSLSSPVALGTGTILGEIRGTVHIADDYVESFVQDLIAGTSEKSIQRVHALLTTHLESKAQTQAEVKAHKQEVHSLLTMRKI